jgi:hypothetical protein
MLIIKKSIINSAHKTFENISINTHCLNFWAFFLRIVLPKTNKFYKKSITEFLKT